MADEIKLPDLEIRIPDILVPRSVLKVMDVHQLAYFSTVCLLNIGKLEYLKKTFTNEEEMRYVLDNLAKDDVRNIQVDGVTATITLKKKYTKPDEAADWYSKMFSDIYECEIVNRTAEENEAVFERNNIFPGIIEYFRELGYEAHINNTPDEGGQLQNNIVVIV